MRTFGAYWLLGEAQAVGRGADYGAFFWARRIEGLGVSGPVVLARYGLEATLPGRFVKRCIADAKARATTGDDRMLKTLEVGRYQGEIFSTLERIVGPSLQTIVERAPTAPLSFIGAVEALADTIEGYARASGRDMRLPMLLPRDVIIDGTGRAVWRL